MHYPGQIGEVRDEIRGQGRENRDERTEISGRALCGPDSVSTLCSLFSDLCFLIY
jgi:hypothetical protein